MNEVKKFLFGKSGMITVIFALAAGLLLIYSQTASANKKEDEAKPVGTDIYEYIEKNEKKLEEIIQSIDTAGECEVMITLENSFESVFASNASVGETDGESSVRNTEKELVLRNSKTDGMTPVVVKEITPKIKGVIVVCEGGENPLTRQKIIDAATVAFDIADNKICVIGKKPT